MYFVVLGAIALLWVVDFVSAQVGFRQPAGPGYAERNACPTRCSIAGPNPSNWSVYHNFDQFHACEQSRFYDFSLYDKVDDANAFHRIYACSSYGPDWTNLPKAKTDVATIQSVGKNTTYELGWWSDGGKLDESGISSLATQLREYLANGYAPTDRMVTLFAQSGQTAVGLYIGRGLQNEGVGTFALEALDTKLLHLKLSASSMAMQLCRPGSDSDQVFGFMATTNGTFGPIQNALKTWANADCLSFPDSRNFTGPAYFTAPMVATTKFPADREKFTKAARSSRLISRANCKTIQVQSGDSCASLAKKCAISAADFTKYNPASNFCSSLKPGQHVCCSSGTLPDFRPKPKPDGSCFPYKFTSGDSCSSVAAANSLTVAELEKFNQKTWGWNGCSNVWAGTIACLSSGKPPFPATVPNAICGPQVPGTKPPTDGSDISKLNPCPLNACCNVWGQVSFSHLRFCQAVLIMNASAVLRMNSA